MTVQGAGICLVHNRLYENRRGMANGIMAPHCPWDGSLHPDVFMEMLNKPGTVLTPTDKNYKVYISVVSDEDPNEQRIISVATGPTPPTMKGEWRRVDDEIRAIAERDGGWRDLDDGWVRLDVRGTTREDKFYFEHLSDAQKVTFLELLNAGRLNLAFPGHFYRLPFFLKAKTP